jgi:hypothetical protein
MGLPHKGENIVAGNIFLACTWKLFFTGTRFSLHEHLTLPFFPCQVNTTDCDYTVRTCISVVLDLLTTTSPVVMFKLKCVCILYVSYSKCAEKTLSLQRVHYPVRECPRPQTKICNCSTRILGMLPVTICNLCWVMFSFSNQYPSSNRFIYCNCLDLEGRHLHHCPLVTIHLLPQGAICGFLPE